MIGLLGMLKHLAAAPAAEPPADPAITRFEGWMLGQKPS